MSFVSKERVCACVCVEGGVGGGGGGGLWKCFLFVVMVINVCTRAYAFFWVSVIIGLELLRAITIQLL